MFNEKRVLVYVSSDILGDALIKLPAISTLRTIFPDHQITWFSGGGKSIFKSALYPLVKNYVDIISDEMILGKSWFELFQTKQSVQSQTVIIDTQHLLKTTLILKKIPHQRFVSPCSKFLFSDEKPKSFDEYYGSSLQERVLLLFNLAGKRNEKINFTLDIPTDYVSLANDLLPDKNNYIGIAPGAGGKNKIWPIERFIEVAIDQKNKNRQVVFFLGPDEVDMYEMLKKTVPEALFPEIENKNKKLAGPLLAMALAKKMKVAVANDSGMGHVCSISSCPLVSLFGPSNSKKFVSTNKNRVIVKASDFGSSEITAIPTKSVMSAIDRLYSE
jgi:ADP-heptose:LPS heptosyltransferase